MFITSCSDDDGPQNSVNNGGGNNLSGCIGGPTTVTDIDGNVYNVVTIGNQCWMKENLKTSKYRNGVPIPGNLSNSAWLNSTTGAQADYNNDSTNSATYGKLYNWYAMVDASGLCPTGWHVPTSTDWNILAITIDSLADTTATVVQSPTAGGKMKAIGTLQSGNGLWEQPNMLATDSTGFHGISGGIRSASGAFSSIGFTGYWGVSTVEPNTLAYGRNLHYNNGNLERNNFGKKSGLSVRCVRD